MKRAVPRPIVGAEKVAHLFGAGLRKVGGSLTAAPIMLNGRPALAIHLDGELDGVMSIRYEDNRISGLYYVRNPEKLSHVEFQTALTLG